MAYRLSRDQVNAIMRNRDVRRGLETAGRQLAGRAQAITTASGGSARISLVKGIRPKGRSFVNVQSDSADEEFGTSKTQRRRALGRAVRERGK